MGCRWQSLVRVCGYNRGQTLAVRISGWPIPSAGGHLGLGGAISGWAPRGIPEHHYRHKCLAHREALIRPSRTLGIFLDFGDREARPPVPASSITANINSAWSGSFTQNGVSYNVTTQVSVQVADSASAASASGAQNVIGLSNGNASSRADSFVSGPNSLATFFRGQDTGTWNYNSMAGTKVRINALIGLTTPNVKNTRFRTVAKTYRNPEAKSNTFLQREIRAFQQRAAHCRNDRFRN